MEPWQFIATVGAFLTACGALVTGFIRMIYQGKWVPGREMEYWREAFFEEQRQKRALMEAGRVTQEVLRSLPQVLEGDEA